MMITSEPMSTEEVEQTRLTRKVASVFTLLGGIIALFGMYDSKNWLTDGTTKSVGPGGTIVDGHEMDWGTFGICNSENQSVLLLSWLEYYGLCFPTAARVSWFCGWIGSIFSILGGIAGLSHSIPLNISVFAVLLGALGLLSSLICFLNWQYVLDLLYDQAFVYSLDSSSSLLEATGPVRMTLGAGIHRMILAFCVNTFALISLMVIRKRIYANTTTNGKGV